MIKGLIIDMDNRFNKVFPVFDPYNKEFSPGSQIIDIFPSWFSFHFSNKCSKNNLIAYSYQLDELTIIFSLDPSYILVVTDASIKNNVVTSITHIHVCDKPIIKTLHYTVNVMTTEAELFAIRCGINQATVMEYFGPNILFFFYLFSFDFILIFFFFFFLFFFLFLFFF